MLILLLALLGQDFETKYHDAYVLEVVDGKPAEAARAYLDLLRAESLPPKLMYQARFRVAVTFALLGRPDEARARLAELAADAETPKSLLPQIAEYRKALEGAGVGNDLEKRMNDLVYSIARTENTTPTEYRDFEIIGASAIPFLRRLQQHTDAAMREHAFRLLCRMNVGGLGEEWDAGWTWALVDLGGYLARNAAEVDGAEERIRALSDADAARVLSRIDQGASFSQEFLDAMVARPAVRPSALRLSAAFAHYGRWIREGERDLALLVVNFYGEMLQKDKTNGVPFDPDLFPHVWRRLVGVPQGGPIVRGFVARVPPETARSALGEMIAITEKWQGAPEGSPLANGLIYRTLQGMDYKLVEAIPFADMLERWMKVGGDDVAETVLAYFGVLIESLPEERGIEIARRFARSPVKVDALRTAMRFWEPKGLPRLLAALEATEGPRRSEIAKEWSGQLNAINRSLAPEYREALLRALPRLLRLLEPEVSTKLAFSVPVLAQGLDPAIAQEAVLTCADRVRSPKEGNLPWMFQQLIQGHGSEEQLLRWRGSVVVPLLPRFAAPEREQYRRDLFEVAWKVLPNGPPALGTEARKAIVAFLRAHPTFCDSAFVYAALQEEYPPEEWIPRVYNNSWQLFKIREPDRVARALAAAPGAPTPSTVAFIVQTASGDVRAQTLTALFQRAAADDAHLFAGLIAPERIRERMHALCRLEPAPVAVVAALASDLARRAPSDDLMPVVKWLVLSGDGAAVRSAIDIAKRLGRPENLPVLESLLDSMDADLRGVAKDAIDSILELRRLKQEVGQRIAEAGVK